VIAPVRTRGTEVTREPGSFRDPSNGVLESDGAVYRFFKGESANDFTAFLKTDLHKDLTASGALIESERIERAAAPALYEAFSGIDLVVEHPRIPFVSYPYEWPFEMLRAAGELQIELTRRAFLHGYNIKDATPYNIQFRGAEPVFIDAGSFEKRRPGTSWRAYSQFCRMFLNPLLLQAASGVPFQPWLRSAIDGIDVEQLAPLLPLSRKLRPGTFVDVVLQSWLNRRFGDNEALVRKVTSQQVSDKTVASMIERAAKQLHGLTRKGGRTVWGDYETGKTHYSSAAERFKEQFVREKLQAAEPGVTWDLGCNAGQYSLIASEASQYVVAMDFDELAVGRLFDRIAGKRKNILPLVVDITNPSPSQGWANRERKALLERGHADWALALALVHHLAIGSNVPLPFIAKWLADASEAVILEFVPKSDPMVQRLLLTREDVFPDYTPLGFEHSIAPYFDVTERVSIPESERLLYVLNRR
jgi:SAM-dependent methyltransferase